MNNNYIYRRSKHTRGFNAYANPKGNYGSRENALDAAFFFCSNRKAESGTHIVNGKTYEVQNNGDTVNINGFQFKK